MRATTIHAPFDIRLSEVAQPAILRPSDAVVQVSAACVCGSDLWSYRGVSSVQPGSRIGHEFVGVVEQVGEDVRSVRVGDFVVAPFAWSDGSCRMCQRGVQTSCETGGYWGAPDREGLPVDGGQGEYVRVPLADGTLVATPEQPSDDLVPSLLALSDVMGTGWHAARAAGVGVGDVVVVVGDGAVGLCAVLAARMMGAEQVVAMSRHPQRQEIAREFGASDIVAERGDDARTRIEELTDGLGADAALECVGTAQSMETALAVTRPGGRIGFVGVPHGVEIPIGRMFGRNLRLGGGVAPVREYLPHLMTAVLGGSINPGRVFDLELPLDDVAEAYRAMHERRATKVLLRP